MIETRVDGNVVPGPTAADVAERKWGDDLLWLNAVAPDSGELEYLVQALRLHPLAAEDLRNRNQRPKVDEYDGQLFIVLFGAAGAEAGKPDGEAADANAQGPQFELSEVHIIVGDGYLASVADRSIPSLAAIAGHCEQRPQLATGLPGMLFYRIADAVVDSFFAVLDALDADIDRLETEIVQRADSRTVSDIFGLKRELNILRRVLGPQRDLLQGLAGPHGPALGQEAQLYLRDVYDHAVRIVEQVDAYRDLVTGALDVYLSSVSNRLGEQTRRLSVVATIFLPLTFFTGFFGQNFGFLVEHIGSTRAFGIGLAVETVSVLFIWIIVRRATVRASPVPTLPPRRGRRRLLRVWLR